MIRFLVLIILFLAAAIAAAIAFTPLGFVMARSGAGGAGAGWAQVQGTLLNGRIDGLHVNGQPVGDVSLKLRPLSLLSFAPQYDVQWGGAGGQGTGVIKISKGRIEASELRLQQKISAIEGLAAPVRAMGGTLRLADGAIALTPVGCESAAGQISTDALSLAAEQYGREFGMITGPLTCIDQDIVLALTGLSERGDSVKVDARTSLLGEALFEVAIETRDSEVSFALSQVGFTLQDGSWRYRYEQQGRLSQ